MEINWGTHDNPDWEFEKPCIIFLNVKTEQQKRDTEYLGHQGFVKARIRNVEILPERTEHEDFRTHSKQQDRCVDMRR